MKKICVFILVVLLAAQSSAQSWDLTPENISTTLRDSAINTNKDPYRPGYHLTPPVGCMGDPNGAIYYNGWFHMFYGLQPFAFHPGAWYWAHARSKDLLNWEHLKPGLTPAFNLGLHAIGSGSTIQSEKGEVLAFYSQSRRGDMEFWRAKFTNEELSEWSHIGRNPVLTLDHPGLPEFDGFWRDPFVFEAEGRTFLIACADLFDENYVPVPIFEARDEHLSDWEYHGILFKVPKHKYRNLEVPEIRQIDGKWIFIASTDAPKDRVVYFLGDLDQEKLTFTIESEGSIDYSGHYYAQESFSDEKGQLYQMAWIPGWDREWLPYYMNEPKKNSNLLWNGCFSIPRKLSLKNGRLVQRPLETLEDLRSQHYTLQAKELHVSGPTTGIEVVKDFHGNQLEIRLQLDLHNASFCGFNVLSDREGKGGLSISWSGDKLNVDGVVVPIEEWKSGDLLDLHIFVDKKIVEVFVNGGLYCVSRQLQENHVKGDYMALTTLGGTARLVKFDAWKLIAINVSPENHK